MELRRALLLFAIVLGVAAVASTLVEPLRDRDRADRGSAPAPDSKGDDSVKTLLFAAGENRPATRALTTSTAATVVVRAPTPGQVSIPGLGLNAPVDPLTPARLDVLTEDPGRYAIRFAPADGRTESRIGVLAVMPPETG